MSALQEQTLGALLRSGALEQMVTELRELAADMNKVGGGHAPRAPALIIAWAVRVDAVAERLAVARTIARASADFNLPKYDEVTVEALRTEVPPAKKRAIAIDLQEKRDVRFRRFESLLPLDERLLVTSLRVAGEEQLVLPEGAGLPLEVLCSSEGIALPVIKPGQRIVIELFNNDARHAHAAHLRFLGAAKKNDEPQQEPKP